MNTSTIDTNPKIRAKVIKGRAEGKPLRQLAAELGTNKDTICKWTNREDVRKAIEAEAARMLELAPKAVDTYNRILNDAAAVEVVPHLVEYEIDDPDNPGKIKTIAIQQDAKVVANNLKLLSIAQIASKDILSTAGILASHTESRTVIAILAGEAAEGLTPMLSQLMGQVIGTKQEPDALAGCIDITPEEEE